MKTSATIYRQIISGFIIVLIIGIVIGISGIASIQIMTSMQNEYDRLYNLESNISDVLAAHYEWRQALTDAVFAGSEFTGSIDPTTCSLGRFLNSEDAKSMKDTELLNLLEKVKEPHNYIHTEAKKVVDYIEAGSLDLAISYLNDNIMPKTQEAISLLKQMTERCASIVGSDFEQIVAFGTMIKLILGGLIIVSVAIGVVLSGFIARKIEKRLELVAKKVEGFSHNLSSGIINLTEASESLANGSSKQAAAIEETSAMMNETESMVAQNAENTRIASQVVTTTLDETNEAGKYMAALMEEMNELKESSDRVGKIVKTIDDISFQTNLLAINATVEAARAGGDSGRSFGVVAEEVRSLAQKSAKASSETSEIIDRNISLTNSSRMSAEKVMQIAQKNAEGMIELNKLIAEINSASEEQASGIKQINVAVTQIEKSTQDTAAIAQENSSTSNSMKDDTVHLEDVVSIIKSLVRNKDA